MGDEYLELEYKFLLITLDKIMKTDELTQLRSMFAHAEERLELIFRTRYKKLLDEEVTKASIQIIKDYLNNEYKTDGFLYANTDSIKIKEDKNERSDS